ncbi:hypothetical protein ILYODFUR_033695 [Ilyodon furcidens]|uniref:Uncharacterized protein n=1 Tax=Ilyodon furcidens TaxID=33524 RepID=A0ABV0UMR2_9TELE
MDGWMEGRKQKQIKDVIKRQKDGETVKDKEKDRYRHEDKMFCLVCRRLHQAAIRGNHGCSHSSILLSVCLYTDPVKNRTVFISLRSTATTPAFSTVSSPPPVSDSSAAAWLGFISASRCSQLKVLMLKKCLKLLRCYDV